MQIIAPAMCVIWLGLAGCTSVNSSAPEQDRIPPPGALTDELRDSVTHLAGDIGQRNCYHPDKLAEAADWIEQQFKSMGYVTRRVPVQVPAGEPFRCGPQTVWNIEADKPGVESPADIVVIGAHYDSKVAMHHWHADGPPIADQPGTPGADDNASGVAGVLAVARMLKDVPLKRTVKFVAFVNEEPPFFQTDSMGSLAYARTLAKECADEAGGGRRILGMISFEMLGYYADSEQKKRPRVTWMSGLTSKPDYVAFLCDWLSGDFATACGKVYSRHSPITLRVTQFPAVGDFVGWSDDWSFWGIHVPAFSVTDTAYLRNDHYHDVSDTPDTLDFTKMADTVWMMRFVAEALGNGK